MGYSPFRGKKLERNEKGCSTLSHSYLLGYLTTFYVTYARARTHAHTQYAASLIQTSLDRTMLAGLEAMPLEITASNTVQCNIGSTIGQLVMHVCKMMLIKYEPAGYKVVH